MGGIFSSDCPKGTNKQGWWKAYCYPNNGYMLKINGRILDPNRGDTGKNCNQQHAGDQCWSQWRTVENVPAYCIDGHVFSPTWNFGELADKACNDPYDTSCSGWGGCANQASARVAGTETVTKTLSGEGQTVVGAGALLLVGAAFLSKKRMTKKRSLPDEQGGHVQLGGDGGVV